MTDDALTYAHEHGERFLDELKAFLRIPSISAQPVHASDVEGAARWLRDHLLAAGFPRAEVMTTPGHPVVFAEWLGGGA